MTFHSEAQLNLQLAYYPPYHSKYNPVERCFGWLEQHWNGSLLDSIDGVLNFAKTLTFKGKTPSVTLVEKIYFTGVKLTKKAMAEVEKQIHRLPNLKKWFVEIFALLRLVIGSFFLWLSLKADHFVQNVSQFRADLRFVAPYQVAGFGVLGQ